MIFFYLLLGIIICWRLKFFASGFDADYISRERTTAINGVFIVMVLLSHAIQSLDAVGYPFNAFGDDVVLSIRSAHLQLIVVTFLFYSGFGVMEQFKKKGLQYLKFMPRRRIWATYVNYLVSAIVLTVVMVCVTKKFDATFIFARLLALDTWYIFAILFCYIAFWLAYSIKQGGGTGILSMLVLMYIAVISPVRPTHYYSTVLTFVFGVVYSKYREQIEAFLKQHYWTMLSVVGSAFVVVYYLFRKCEGVCYNGLAILFVLLIVIVSLKIKIGNPILGWLGAHLFPIYLYHPVFYRLYLHYFGAPSLVAVILFLLVSFTMTFMIAHLYKYWKYEPSSSVKC